MSIIVPGSPTGNTLALSHISDSPSTYLSFGAKGDLPWASGRKELLAWVGPTIEAVLYQRSWIQDCFDSTHACNSLLPEAHETCQKTANRHFSSLKRCFEQLYLHRKTLQNWCYHKSPSEKGLWRGNLTVLGALNGSPVIYLQTKKEW